MSALLIGKKFHASAERLGRCNSQINGLANWVDNCNVSGAPSENLGGSVHSEPSLRALDFMRCALPEQRRCSRVHLPIRATVVFPSSSAEPQIAFLRDVNMLGAFFYCRHKASIGQTARLEFALPGDGGPSKAICQGVILRVEESAPGAAIGVAIEFTRYELTRPMRAEQDQAQEEHTGFIAWTVDVVERMFVKSRHFRISNQERGQAA